MNEPQTNVYPTLVVKPNQNPNRLYAVPFLGIVVKVFMLLPVAFWLIPLAIASLFFWIGTPFVILFTGKYWDAAYDFQVGLMHWSAKLSLFLTGITDKYPGFALKGNDSFILTINKPETPNRLLALPLLGLFIRSILIIPYYIFSNILTYGSQVAIFFSWFAVLFKGKYPESLHEFLVDSLRVSYASNMYLFYLSDKYPSFNFPMKNKRVKIFLIIAGALLMINNTHNSWQEDQKNEQVQPTPSSMDYINR